MNPKLTAYSTAAALVLALASVCVAQTVELTAEGSGYYRVYIDDAEVSKHVAEREAIERATNEAIENPNAVVRYAHDYSVSVVVNGVDVEPEPDPEPEPEPQPDPDPTPEPEPDPQPHPPAADGEPIDFTDVELLPYGTQDAGEGPLVEDDGKTIHLRPQNWKQCQLPYTVTENTVLEFDLRNTGRPDLLFIGFANDPEVIDGEHGFRLSGYHEVGIVNVPEYLTHNWQSVTPKWQHYTIPVGYFFTGDFERLAFINDNDSGDDVPECYFSNVKLYEAEPVVELPDPVLTDEHFAALNGNPALVNAWSLKDMSQWSRRRGGGPHYTTVRYDADIDAARFSLPSRANEGGGFMFNWNVPSWEVGDTLVVQHEFYLSKALRLHAPATGENGRRTTRYKFTNLCRDGDKITYELRTWLTAPKVTALDVRCYPPLLEGRMDRDVFASDVLDPTVSKHESGGDYDRQPGPDTSWPYERLLPHPQTFRATDERWVRVTYEMERVAEGTRVKVWLADEQVEPKLIVASVSDPSKGFLTDNDLPIDSFYFEMDTSQETTYAEDQPERWIGFRHLAVLHGIRGEDVLGGKVR